MTAMKNLFLLTALLFIVACGDTAPADTPETKSAEMVERIQTMEDSLFNTTEFDRRKAQGLVDVYKAYAAAFPLDSLAPEYLFRAAGVYKSMRQPEQSVMLYDRIINDYRGWPRLADAYYLKAFTIDSELDQKGEAQRAYKEVINLFPDHPFARDARIMIENLSLTDEELIEKFQRMAEEQEAQAAE